MHQINIFLLSILLVQRICSTHIASSCNPQNCACFFFRFLPLSLFLFCYLLKWNMGAFSPSLLSLLLTIVWVIRDHAGCWTRESHREREKWEKEKVIFVLRSKPSGITVMMFVYELTSPKAFGLLIYFLPFHSQSLLVASSTALILPSVDASNDLFSSETSQTSSILISESTRSKLKSKCLNTEPLRKSEEMERSIPLHQKIIQQFNSIHWVRVSESVCFLNNPSQKERCKFNRCHLKVKASVSCMTAAPLYEAEPKSWRKKRKVFDSRRFKASTLSERCDTPHRVRESFS